MRIQYVHVLLVIMGTLCISNMMDGVKVAAEANLGEQCSGEFEKVAACLSYVTAKVEAPTKDCCTAVNDIRDTQPVCLCYIILQTHNGSRQITSMGIQGSRLLQLPTSCKLVNASVSDCPKLLNISKSSPDYNIFSNSTSSNDAASSTIPPKTVDGSSNGNRYELHHHLVGFTTIAVAIFFFAFPVGFLPSSSST